MSRTPNARSALPLHLFTPVQRVEDCRQLRTCENRSMSEFGGKAENICEAPGDRQGVESASLLR